MRKVYIYFRYTIIMQELNISKVAYIDETENSVDVGREVCPVSSY